MACQDVLQGNKIALLLHSLLLVCERVRACVCVHIQCHLFCCVYGLCTMVDNFAQRKKSNACVMSSDVAKPFYLQMTTITQKTLHKEQQ